MAVSCVVQHLSSFPNALVKLTLMHVARTRIDLEVDDTGLSGSLNVVTATVCLIDLCFYFGGDSLDDGVIGDLAGVRSVHDHTRRPVWSASPELRNAGVTQELATSKRAPMSQRH